MHCHWRQSSQNQQGTGCCRDLELITLIKRETRHGEGGREKGFSVLFLSVATIARELVIVSDCT